MMKKKKSIKRTLLIGMISLSVSISILLGAASCFVLYKTSYEGMSSEVTLASQAYGQAVQNKFDQYKTAIEAIGRNEEITKSGATADELKAVKAKLAKQYGFMDVHTADATGQNDLGTSCADREYFKQAMNGVSYISSPLTRKSDNSTVVYISAKIDNSTGYKGIVFAALSSDSFSSMVDKASVGASGYTFVLDKAGAVVAHKDKSIVNKFVNYLDQAKKSGNTEQTAVAQNMISGKTGSQSYTVNGVNQYIAYRPIPDTDGWSVGTTATVSDMMSGFYATIYILIGLAILFIAIAAFVAFKIAKPIAKPIISMVQRFEKLAQGDLHTEVPVIASEDEIGVLSNSFAGTVSTLNSYVGEISTVLTSLSAGDYTVETHQDYMGDFVAIKDALNVIISNLNNVFTSINQSADQVANGSDHLLMSSCLCRIT
jgi:methyl-accepting chemotaxis protein